MTVLLTINGQAFEYPTNFDEGWGSAASGWAQAVTSGVLTLSGGNFPLTHAVDFGASFGAKLLTLTSKSSNPASSGYLRLAVGDSLAWRNTANDGNLLLSVDGSDMLTFNGSVLGLTALSQNHIYVGDASNNPASVAMSGDATIVASGALTIANGAVNNAKVASGAAIAVNKLAAQTVSRAVAFDSSGFLSPSATTAVQLGYLSTATSDIQTQINAIQQVPSGAMLDFAGVAAPTGWLLCDGSAVSRSTYAALFSAIGTAWGSGNGSTTFNIPNMTRRVGMGSGGSSSGTIGNVVGNTGGEETHTLTAPEMPTHNHAALSSVTDPGHAHVEQVYSSSAGGSRAVGSSSATGGGTTNVADFPAGTVSATTGITVATSTTNTGGGGSHNNIQPSAIVLKIIKI